VFTKSLGAALTRPTFFPMPALVVKALFGQMGTEVLCADVGVLPQVLLDRGFEWDFTDIKSCFDACLAKQF
jgi:NAD dependent epimerase/dehydratase family enzyme